MDCSENDSQGHFPVLQFFKISDNGDFLLAKSDRNISKQRSKSCSLSSLTTYSNGSMIARTHMDRAEMTSFLTFCHDEDSSDKCHVMATQFNHCGMRQWGCGKDLNSNTHRFSPTNIRKFEEFFVLISTRRENGSGRNELFALNFKSLCILQVITLPLTNVLLAPIFLLVNIILKVGH